MCLSRCQRHPQPLDTVLKTHIITCVIPRYQRHHPLHYWTPIPTTFLVTCTPHVTDDPRQPLDTVPKTLLITCASHVTENLPNYWTQYRQHTSPLVPYHVTDDLPNYWTQHKQHISSLVPYHVTGDPPHLSDTSTDEIPHHLYPYVTDDTPNHYTPIPTTHLITCVSHVTDDLPTISPNFGHNTDNTPHRLCLITLPTTPPQISDTSTGDTPHHLYPPRYRRPSNHWTQYRRHISSLVPPTLPMTPPQPLDTSIDNTPHHSYTPRYRRPPPLSTDDTVPLPLSLDRTGARLPIPKTALSPSNPAAAPEAVWQDLNLPPLALSFSMTWTAFVGITR